MVSIVDVSFSYGRKRVLHDVDWQLREGVTGLIGPNGAGKTTLINLLVGIARPTQGDITVSDSSGRSRAVREANVGFVPQRFSVAAEMRVADTVAYVAWVNGVDRRTCMARAAAALEKVDLGEQMRDRVRSLSGGQRQRLGIAAGISHTPELLILDEPTVGLDPGQRVRAREVIQRVGADIPVLLSTHLIEDVSHLCRRVGVMTDGRIIFDGTQAELEQQLEQVDSGSGLGSPFERSYQALIDRMSAS